MRVVATAGHVDHGKSTLVRRLTGMEPDRWEEERRRGLTIDLGFVWTNLDEDDEDDDVGGGLTVAFVDVPGHERFVPNMLAGAGSIGECILVVAADDGWSAQTAEHVAILDLLGVRCLVTAVTKASLVSESRLAAVVEEVTDRLDGTSLAEAPVVAVDSLTERGVPAFTATLVARLRSTAPPVATASARRLWIDRSFTVPGAGTVVTGTLQGGPLVVDQEVLHAPSGRLMRIRGLHALGKPVDHAPAGSRVGVNLARVSAEELTRGDALLADDWLLSTAADVMLRSVSPDPIQSRGAWHLHIGTAEVLVRLRPLLDRMEPGQRGPVQIELAKPLPLRHGDRFVVRSVGTQRTVGGGRVLDPRPRERASGMLARLERAEGLEALATADTTDQRLAALLSLHDGHMASARARASMDLQDGGELGDVVPVGTDLVRKDVLLRWEQAVLAAVRAGRDSRGVPVTEAAQAAGAGGCPSRLRQAVVERLCHEGRLVVHRDVVTLPDAAPAYLAARAKRQDAVLDQMSRDLFNPPEIDEVADRVGIEGTEYRALFEDGRLVRLDDVVVTGAAIDAAARMLREAAGPGGVTAAEARDLWGTTRKYALPLLEHLAAAGITVFDGTRHRLAQGPESAEGGGALEGRPEHGS